MAKKKPTRRSKKPIGYVKQGKSYRLVFGSKTKPRLSTKRFMSKKTLLAEAKKRFKK